MQPPEHRSPPNNFDDADDPAGGIEAAHELIMRWDSTTSEDARDRMIFDGDRREVDRYLRAVDEIRRSIDSSSAADPTGAIQIAMARLEDEFRNILITHSSPVETDALSDHLNSLSISGGRSGDFDVGDDDEEDEDRQKLQELEADRRSSSSRRSSTTSIREVDLVPSDAISDLRSIAERMITSGYLRECIQVYGSVRKSVVDAGFRQLGIERLSIGDVQRLEWEAVDTKIRRWIRAARICVRILFPSERRICERIFEGLGAEEDAGDACFMETVKGAAIQLFNFAEAISISRRSPEKLFKILDLHDALSDLLPDVAAVFHSGSSESVRFQVAEILSRLAEAARGILSEFENAVQREQSKTPVPGGTIHPITRYVMNYISLISDYRLTLTELVVSKPSAAAAPEIEFPQSEDQSPLAHHMTWIIMALLSNLENKSKLYKDADLSHLFIMNNVHYIVQKAKGSPELREMIGDHYLKRLTGLFRQSATSYQRATWVKILHCLRDEGIHVRGGFASSVSKSALRERFKNFNSAFEEAHRNQSTWSVPDPQLREELRISITEKLLPAYRSFLGRFRHHLESGRHSEMYIKYSVEDLESALLDFFEASPVPQHIRKRSHFR